MTPQPERQKLSCPHCGVLFDFFMGSASGINDGTPIVCEKCCDVGILDSGVIRKVKPEEEERVKRNRSVSRMREAFRLQKRAAAARWN